jgi:septum formation protein
MNHQYKIILASNSPRRKELLAGLDIPFTVRLIDGIREDYPLSMECDQVAEYIAREKAAAYLASLADDELVITADTVVICDNRIMGKPHDAADAVRMLSALSGKTHHVVTGVCITTRGRQKSFSVSSSVTFAPLSDDEIKYYVDKYQPMDKAGAYGIQEWIGYIGVTRLEGSYFNVMGFPVQRVYAELKNFLGGNVNIDA